MMTDKLRAAAQEAYRAMISAELSDGSRREWEAAVDGLKAALAEPTVKDSLTVAEPVAWKHPDKNMVFWEDTKEVDEYHGFKSTIPLYTAPPRREWVGLTIKDINQFETWFDDEEERKGWVDPALIAKYFEAKLKEKNGG